MDETEVDDVLTVGQRLKQAREAKGLSIEDIAATTRIPTRHLASLEQSEWDKLPAATYSVGFAKNYAGAVDLDRAEISEQLRAEMGGTRLAAAHPEIYEATDPARTMPKGLVIAALGLLVLVVLALSWLSNRSMQPEEQVAEANAVTPEAATAPPPAAAAAPAAAGAVVLTATDAVWFQIKDGGNTLHEGLLAAGQSYTLPATAAAPVLTTGKPEALRIMVGSTQAPAIGEAGKTVTGVSLRAADLLASRAPIPAAATAGPAVASAPAVRPRPAAPQPARNRPQSIAPSPPAASPSVPQGNSAAPSNTL